MANTSAVTSKTTKSLVAALVADVAFVVLFTFIGTRNHDTESHSGGVLSTAAPFIIGIAVAWLVLRAWRQPFAVATGVGIWIISIVVGMLLRHFAWDRGTAGAFIVVATIFNAFTLVGWRFIRESILTRKSH